MTELYTKYPPKRHDSMNTIPRDRLKSTEISMREAEMKEGNRYFHEPNHCEQMCAKEGNSVNNCN